MESEALLPIEQERLVTRIAWRIRQSLDLGNILDTTVAEVRELLDTDRVVVYRFSTDWTGVVTTEAVLPGWPALIHQQFEDVCFTSNYIHPYQEGRVGNISNIESAPIQPCHREMLQRFAVRANLVVPILQGVTLWGLLILHHCRGPRPWTDLEINLLQDLALQVGIAIQQSELYAQVQRLNSTLETQVQERTRELRQILEFTDVLSQITHRVRDSLDERHVLQTAVEELGQVLRVDYCGAALYNLEHTKAVMHYEYLRPQVRSLLGEALILEEWGGTLPQPEQTRLLMPIQDDRGVLGYLLLGHHSNRAFSPSEQQLGRQVANQCGIALRQARLYQSAQTQVQELSHLNQMKDEFLSAVSHELRTPMTNMKLAIRLLKLNLGERELEAQTKGEQYLKILQDECDREIHLINNLLDLQRLDSGQFTPQWDQIRIQEWLPAVLTPFQERIREREQGFHLDLSADLPPFVGDVSSLERVIVELVNNACKYTPSQGRISASLSCREGQFQLRVCNTGVEIPQGELEKVFEKFYRVPSADPWKQGGTGLGLALVQKLVQYMGGEISVTSSGNQTCFHVHVPNHNPG